MAGRTASFIAYKKAPFRGPFCLAIFQFDCRVMQAADTFHATRLAIVEALGTSATSAIPNHLLSADHEWRLSNPVAHLRRVNEGVSVVTSPLLKHWEDDAFDRNRQAPAHCLRVPGFDVRGAAMGAVTDAVHCLMRGQASVRGRQVRIQRGELHVDRAASASQKRKIDRRGAS